MRRAVLCGLAVLHVFHRSDAALDDDHPPAPRTGTTTRAIPGEAKGVRVR